MCDSVTLLRFATTTMKVTVVPSKVMRETPPAPLARGGTSFSGPSVASKSVTSSSELQLMPPVAAARRTANRAARRMLASWWALPTSTYQDPALERRVVGASVVVVAAGPRDREDAGLLRLAGRQHVHVIHRRTVGVDRMRIREYLVGLRVVVDERHAAADRDLDLLGADAGRGDRHHGLPGRGRERGGRRGRRRVDGRGRAAPAAARGQCETGQPSPAH